MGAAEGDFKARGILTQRRKGAERRREGKTQRTGGEAREWGTGVGYDGGRLRGKLEREEGEA
jgi:hypothetical protein